MWKLQMKIPIPKNLEECYEQLEKYADQNLIETYKRISEQDLPTYHFGFGMHIRNKWGLWSGSPLKDYFKSLGIYHADDMSGIIIKGFWYHLNNKKFDLDKEVKHYRDYWANMIGKQPDRQDIKYIDEWETFN
jgi:hypothetical protein